MRWSWWITKICHLQISPTALNIDSAAEQLHVQKFHRLTGNVFRLDGQP